MDMNNPKDMAKAVSNMSVCSMGTWLLARTESVLLKTLQLDRDEARCMLEAVPVEPLGLVFFRLLRTKMLRFSQNSLGKNKVTLITE